MRLLIRGGRLVGLDGGPARLADALIVDGLVADVGAGIVAPGAQRLDARGAWLIPGLWDKHVHFSQWVRAAEMLDLREATGPEEVCARVSRAPGEPLFGFGYRGRPGTVADLDAAADGRAVVLISGDAHHGWLSSAALRLAGLAPREATVTEGEWFDAWARLTRTPPSPAAEAAALAGIVAKGVVGIVDLAFEDAYRAWPRRDLPPLRVRAGVYPHQLDDAVGRGLRTGQRLAARVEMGPLKVITDGSLGTRTAWCHDAYVGSPGHCGAPNVTPEELTDLLRRATAAGLEVALHAIGDRAATQALDAFAATGAKGSIEHAQLLRPDDIARFARLQVVASVQPHHLVDDRDPAARLWADRTARLFPARALLDAGAALALGSDAPVSPLDPWLAIACAVHRSGDDRPAWHPEQSLTPREALAASVDGRRIAPGQPGDLVLLGADPLAPAEPAEAAARLRAMPVLATVCAGQLTHRLG